MRNVFVLTLLLSMTTVPLLGMDSEKKGCGLFRYLSDFYHGEYCQGFIDDIFSAIDEEFYPEADENNANDEDLGDAEPSSPYVTRAERDMMPAFFLSSLLLKTLVVLEY